MKRSNLELHFFRGLGDRDKNARFYPFQLARLNGDGPTNQPTDRPSDLWTKQCSGVARNKKCEFSIDLLQALIDLRSTFFRLLQAKID